MQEELSFGVWLRKQRRALDLSRKVFANQVGCAEVTLRRIEAGILKPSKELAGFLLEKLGIPLSSSPASNKLTTNPPAPITTFIGREKQQSDVMRLINKHCLGHSPGGNAGVKLLLHDTHVA
jgi:transcriptional regulator with XRE-family HTH domain